MAINLNSPALQIGRRPMPQLPPGMAPQGGGAQLIQLQQQPISQDARSYGMAEALANPATVESGSWGEALAEALTMGLRGRALARERQSELNDHAKALAREGDQTALQNELTRAQIDNIRAQALQRGATGQWSDPYQLDGAYVRRNNQTNETVQVVPRRPAPRSASGGAPELPTGFVWSD